MKSVKLFSTKTTAILDVQHRDTISIAQFEHHPCNTLSFQSVHRAYEKNLLTVEEVCDEGRVNELRLRNFSDECILIMDGDILKGAKQNRVVNTSVVVAPRCEIFIPVSCVEQGRWTYHRNDFMPSEEVAYRKIREQKSRLFRIRPLSTTASSRTTSALLPTLRTVASDQFR